MDDFSVNGLIGTRELWWLYGDSVGLQFLKVWALLCMGVYSCVDIKRERERECGGVDGRSGREKLEDRHMRWHING